MLTEVAIYKINLLSTPVTKPKHLSFTPFMMRQTTFYNRYRVAPSQSIQKPLLPKNKAGEVIFNCITKQ